MEIPGIEDAGKVMSKRRVCVNVGFGGLTGGMEAMAWL